MSTRRPGRSRVAAAEPASPFGEEVAASLQPIALTRAITIVVLAGVLTGLAFAPFGIVPAAWIGVAVLFAYWERSTVRRAVLLGFAFGTGLFLTGAYWLLPTAYRSQAATGPASFIWNGRLVGMFFPSIGF